MPNKLSSETSPSGATRRDFLKIAGVVSLLAGVVATGLYVERKATTLFTISQLEHMTEADKQQLIEQGTLLGISNVKVHVARDEAIDTQITLSTQYGPIRTTKTIEKVRYQLVDQTGSIMGYADNEHGELPIYPNDTNVHGFESQGIVHAVLAMGEPSNSSKDAIQPNGYYLQILDTL